MFASLVLQSSARNPVTTEVWRQATDTDGTSIGASGGCLVTHQTMTAATATATSSTTVMIIRARVERGTG